MRAQRRLNHARSYKTIPLRVDFWKHERDWRAGWLAAKGMKSPEIARKLGLTLGQVNYRIHASGCDEQRRKWRDGTSDLFNAVDESPTVKLIGKQQRLAIAEAHGDVKRTPRGKRGR